MNKEQEQLIQKYNIYIYERVQDLLNSGKNIDDFDYKTDLHKIFEYFSCIKLTQEYNTPFYEYADIDPTFKEEKQMSRNDTGIDACNLIDTIVQCKLRQQSLTWKECGTFFGSIVYMDEDGELKTRWKKLIITRNQESKLSDNLNDKLRFKQFTDKTYPRTELLSYCKNLIENPPEHLKNDTNTKIEKREYQEECIKLINEMNDMNLIICLPTGTGKNFIITHSLLPKVKYLIMVPRIILMEQIKDEIIKHHPKIKSKIQMIGDSNNEFKTDKDITICVFNSVDIVKEHIELFDKIFVDEAHHIRKPEIYKDEDEYSYSSSDMDSDEEEFDEDASYSDDEYFDDEEIEEENEDENDDEDEHRKEQKEEDDPENENCDNKSFIKTIKEFSKLNNNVYLSATIDEHQGFNFYKKDIREMTEKGYLCDYTINIPIFPEDPTNESVCKYLVKNYRNIIVYCNSQKNGTMINKFLNKIQKGCSEYIDCNTSRKKRNDIIVNYKSGKLPFLVNVRILVEGFDAPITKGVCFMSLPSSSTTLIQIIGRALRLHPEKTIANVILPFSKMDDEKAIANFMKIMAKNDARIRKSYKSKKLGGYFDLENVFDDEETFNDNSDLMNDVELKYELIFDSIGELKNIEEIWEKKLEEVKKYIGENKKRPSSTDKDKQIKKLGGWLVHQKIYYKTREYIMKNDIIYNKFKNFLEIYKEYFPSNEEVWNNNLKLVIQYIDMNQKLPSGYDKDKEIKTLGLWIRTQKTNYRTKLRIMSNINIYNKFKEFLELYKKYFISNEEFWNNNLEKVIKYINMNKKTPSAADKEVGYLGGWLSDQKKNYKKREQIMKNDIIYNKFKDFLETYKEYFLSNIEIWNNNLEKVIEYIKENNKLPYEKEKNNEIGKLGKWVSTQKKNYKIRKEIMKNDIIYNKFTIFLEDYKEYFLSNEEIWNNNLENVIEYINLNKKTPSSKDKDKEIKCLGLWIVTQKKNYINQINIMKNNIIYNKFKDFLEKYKEYFVSNEEIWNNNLEEVIKYININKKTPSINDTNIKIKKIARWLFAQKQNHKNQIDIMKDDIIYNKFKDFQEKYKEYFLTNEEVWNNNLEKIIQYIKENKKPPSKHNKYEEIKTLGLWIRTQTKNYKTREYIMKDDIIYNKFKEFLETYNEYFINYYSF